MAGNDVVFNIRERGGRQTAREVERVGGRIGMLGNQSARTAARAQLLGKATSGLRHPFRYLREEATGLGKSILGMGLAFGSVEGIKHSIETTDELVKSTVQLRHQFGLTTESASTLSGVLQTRGISPMALRLGFVTLSKAMVNLKGGTAGMTAGNQRLVRDFGRVGLSVRDVKRELHSKDGLAHVFDATANSLTKMDGGAVKAATGQDLLGRASRGLAPLLMKGALGLRQQEKWARQFGVTLDEKTVGGVEGMAAAQTKAQYAALGLQIQMGQLLAPALTKVNTTFSDVVQSFRDGHPEGNKFARTIYKIGMDLKPVGHDLALVGGYLKDHPRLLRAAALGFIAYKTKLLSLLGFAPKAYLSGLISGRAYARGIQTGAAEGAAANRAGWASFGTRIGGWIGPAMGIALAGYVGDQLLNKLLGAGADLLSGPTAAGLAADRDPMVRKTRALGRYNRLHPALHRNFLRNHPNAREGEREFDDLSTGGLLHGAAGAAQVRKSNQLEDWLRRIGDPMFTPRNAKELRHYAEANHVTIVQIDGKTIAKAVNRYNDDKRARR